MPREKVYSSAIVPDYMNRERMLDYPKPAPPAPGEVHMVAPRVHWLRMPLPFALNHVNLWLIEDRSELAIVDCGYGDGTTRLLWEKVFAGFFAGRPASRVIATHLHPDHAGNAYWLTERFDAPLCMSQADYALAHAWRDEAAGYTIDALLNHFRRHGLGDERLVALVQRGNAYARGVPDFPHHFHRILDGDRIPLGGEKWQVIMGYGHAPEHASLYCADLGVLIAGDMLLPNISTNIGVSQVDPDANPLALFLGSLRRLAELPADTLVLPSHGLPFRGMRERVIQLEEHHRMRLAELADACDEPKCAAEVISTLFRRELDDHQTFFAMGEAIAHLNYLMYDGALRRESEADGVLRFKRIRSIQTP
jgi:glyoxylase-like metal-dependent hydrolase (beta-lactamase superfamily II)